MSRPNPSRHRTSPPLAIAVGDAAGVGPRVTIDALAAVLGAGTGESDGALLFGDAARLMRDPRLLGLGAARLDSAAEFASMGGRIGVVDAGALEDSAIAAHAPRADVGAHALAALDAAIDAVVGGHARAVVTGPVSKEAIVAAGHAFIGQTEHLARRVGLADDDVTMLFLGPRLRVGLVTTHLAIADVPSAIDARRVERTIRHLADALVRLRRGSPLRVEVVGLNPHAGEGGLFGREELDVVAPVCAQLRREPFFDGHPITLVGPRASEASFREAASGSVDGVVAMMHDQATIASKLLDWGNAVNVTWGLPFVRTSVDHGVAYDAARAGTAEADGMIAAIQMACALTEPS